MAEDQPAIDIEDIDSCIAKLSDLDPCTIAAGAFSLSWHTDTRKIEPLLRLLEHNDENVRHAAVMGLAHVVDENIEKDIIKLSANDPSPKVRAVAVSLLANGSKKAIAAIIAAANDPDPDVRTQVTMEFMWQRSKQGIRILKNMLSDPDWKVKKAACSSLLLHKVADAQIITTIQQLAQEPETAEYDERALALREELHKQTENTKSESMAASSIRTMQEMLGYAQELANTRKGLLSFIRR